MHLFGLTLSIALSVGMVLSASLKFLRSPRIVRLMADVGVTKPRDLFMLGALQVAASVGLVAGLWFAVIAIAAAVGLVLYFAGAIGAHLRARDTRVLAPIVLLAWAGLTLTLLIVA